MGISCGLAPGGKGGDTTAAEGLASLALIGQSELLELSQTQTPLLELVTAEARGAPMVLQHRVELANLEEKLSSRLSRWRGHQVATIPMARREANTRLSCEIAEARSVALAIAAAWVTGVAPKKPSFP